MEGHQEKMREGGEDEDDEHNSSYKSDVFETDDDEEETSENLLMTRFEIGKLKVVFQKADQDRDGMLTKKDIQDLLEGRRGEREDVERFRRWCKKVGVDIRGGIDYIFKFFDRQQSGVVDWHSFAAALEADIRLDLVRQETLKISPDKSDEIRIRGGFTHVLVVARVRPISKNERKKAQESKTKKDDAPLVCVQVSESSKGHHLVGIEKPGNKKAVLKSQARPKRNFFAFDKVFGPTSTTPQIYRTVIVPNRLVERFLDGISVTIFAYGATGSGKSYTMMGSKYTSRSNSVHATSPTPGIVQLILADVFASHQNERGVSVDFTASYLEIYNETLHDLLSADEDGSGGKKKKLILCEDPRSHVVDVIGLTKTKVESTVDVMKLVNQGNKRRVMASTAANEFSSRSHAILQLHSKRRERLASGGHRETLSVLTLVDLAGSERASQTLNRGKRLREGANINRSLLALGSCIKALALRGGGSGDGANKGRKNPKRRQSSAARPKFRDSKLTLLLKNSLEGRSVLVMLAMASPSSVRDVSLSLFFPSPNSKSIIQSNLINFKKTGTVQRYVEHV